MLKFTPITVENFQPVLPLVQQEQQNECGFSTAPLYAPYTNGRFALYKSICVFLYTEDGKTHCNLLGNPNQADYATIVDALLAKHVAIEFHYLSKEKAEILHTLLPDAVLTDEVDLYDYRYRISDFVSLTGKENQKKRSQYNHFMANHHIAYAEISAANKADCKMVCTNWCARKDCNDCKYTCEQKIIFDLLDNWEKYPCKGGILYTDDEPIAFLICEPVGDTVFGYHQKTCSTEKGLGYAIYVETLSRSFSDYTYFNFGPDMGLSGLRQFKRSFKPFEQIPKYTVKYKK